jgi:hypothetical protein
MSYQNGEKKKKKEKKIFYGDSHVRRKSESFFG